MKSLFLCLFIAGTLFESCGKQCVVSPGYQGGVVLLPDGSSLPISPNSDGTYTVQGYDCNEIRLLDKDGLPLPIQGTK